MQISIYPRLWSTALNKRILKYITRVQDHCMEKSYTKWLKLGKMCRIYQHISIYTWVNYSSQCPQCNENHINLRGLYGQIIHPVLLKWGEKRRKHQHFIYSRLWVWYSYYAMILETPTVTREYYVETSCAKCYWNWVRNVECMSTHLFTNTSEGHHLMKLF
jgi:hypothetical protein